MTKTRKGRRGATQRQRDESSKSILGRRVISRNEHEQVLDDYPLIDDKGIGSQVVCEVGSDNRSRFFDLPALMIQGPLPRAKDFHLRPFWLPPAKRLQPGWFCIEMKWPDEDRTLRVRLDATETALSWVCAVERYGFGLVCPGEIGRTLVIDAETVQECGWPRISLIFGVAACLVNNLMSEPWRPGGPA